MKRPFVFKNELTFILFYCPSLSFRMWQVAPLLLFIRHNHMARPLPRVTYLGLTVTFLICLGLSPNLKMKQPVFHTETSVICVVYFLALFFPNEVFQSFCIHKLLALGRRQTSTPWNSLCMLLVCIVIDINKRLSLTNKLYLQLSLSVWYFH